MIDVKATIAEAARIQAANRAEQAKLAAAYGIKK